MQHKRSFIALIGAALVLTGCSTVSSIGDVIPRSLERTSLFYKMDVQQGNSVDQAMINRLQPGMSKTQVQYVMGTPMLVDVFHLDRWDYYFSLHKGSGEKEQRQLSLYFQDNRLLRIEGAMRPLPEDDTAPLQEAKVYDVPDYHENKGIFTRMLEATGLEDE
jgi:outer membrane protein assembly factor BamE